MVLQEEDVKNEAKCLLIAGEKIKQHENKKLEKSTV